MNDSGAADPSPTTPSPTTPSSINTNRPSPWSSAPLLGALIVVAAFVVYLPAVGGDFLWDDDKHFSENPLMTQPGGLKALWSSGVFYYPLTSTTFWVERRLWGLNSVPYHQLNIVLHAANALLLIGLLRKLRVRGAWLAGAIFALHPVHVQSVAWMTELKNVQSGLFFLLALLAWVRFEDTDRWRWHGLALGLFLLALLSKTSTVMFPVALLLIHARLKKPWNFRILSRVLPFFALSLLAGLLTVILHRTQVTSAPQWSESIPQRIAIAGHATWFYLLKLLWPSGLSFVYPRWSIDAGQWTAFIPAIGVLLLVAALFQFRTRLGTGPLLAFLYFVVSLFPVMGFFRMYYTRYSYVADHWQYLASMGAIAWGGAGLAALAGLRVFQEPRHRGWRFAPAIIPLAMLSVLAVLTYRQASIYRNAETLWLDTLRKNPGAVIATNNLGTYYAEREQYRTALSIFQDGLTHDDQDPDLMSNLGATLVELGRAEEALPLLRRALTKASMDSRTLNSLGLALSQLGRLQEAKDAFRTGIEQFPALPEGYNNLATALDLSGEIHEAITVLEAGLRIAPSDPTLSANLVILQRKKGSLDRRTPEEAAPSR